MSRGRLNDLAIFVEVARANGFRAAAKNLKLGAGSVSEAVQRFEDRLGVRLFERTTREISLTRAGEALYRRSLPAIDELDTALEEINEFREGLTGTLRLSAPVGTGQLFLDTAISDFAALYPTLAIEVIYDERKVDLLTSGIDAAIRVETLLDPDTYAISIGPPHEMKVVAQPSYLVEAGPLHFPHDIVRHEGICFAFGDSEKLAPWVFKTRDGPITVMPKPRVISNNVNSILRYAEAGLGLAYLFSASAEPAIRSGRLIEVLPKSLERLPCFSLNYLSKRNVPARLQAFKNFVKARKMGRS
ncbi:LysR family transcriptional regulator [Leisingera sp. M658]|uniref:LysR family transcriptional regulator n=1 Tax=Leisingera sp. M658 TaxID=2867015 RepID=UPI0021A581BF|nr:LysR family transcriptional regulator [Leisingera sp. M658]UWQ77299.1 LysR family transcriptional regulator [Leisingera sp. M658]